LTTGSYSAEQIALTPPGVSIVSPKSESEKAESMKTALFKIPFFQKFFTNFNQGIVPKKEFLLNTLNREYGITTDECEACYEITMKNARELGILVNIKGNDYIQLEKLSTDTVVENFEEPGETDEERTDEQSPTKDLSQLFKTEKQGPQTIEKQKPRVFISHSRNKKIVQQIETILKFGQFDYENAEERETIAIPISEKVFGLMKDCNCAIINLSVDEQEESDGGYKLNSNVLIEIGAAFLQYDRRVILLVDKRLSAQLPSNLNGLYRCEYQGDELSFDTAMKLQEALTKFREKKQK
jgi:predicted nucleotide-binding protein